MIALLAFVICSEMDWPPKGCFEIKAAFPAASAPWPVSDKALWPNAKPINDDAEKKALFGLLIQKFKPFEAALQLFGDDTAKALWVSQNWINDPEVINAKQIEEKDLKFLDKERVAGKALDFFEEKDPSGRFHVHEGKERLAALELYAKIAGYLNSKNDGASINFDNRTMNIKLVAPDRKEEPQIIETSSEIVENVVPLKVKLVR